MNIWLSPHGIWYYRKVTTLPCGRRKDIKKSLRTRDKLAAREQVAKMLACARSRVKPAAVQPEPQSHSLPELQQLLQQIQPAVNPAPNAAPAAHSVISSPVLSELNKRYLKEKALSWAPKELSNQKNYIGYFIKTLGDRSPIAYQGQCGQVQRRIAELRQEPDDYQQVPPEALTVVRLARQSPRGHRQSLCWAQATAGQRGQCSK